VSISARKVHIRRENLYRILSEGGNPALKTFTMLLDAMVFIPFPEINGTKSARIMRQI